MKIVSIVLNDDSDPDYITVEDNDGTRVKMATVVRAEQISELFDALANGDTVQVAPVARVAVGK